MDAVFLTFSVRQIMSLKFFIRGKKEIKTLLSFEFNPTAISALITQSKWAKAACAAQLGIDFFVSALF